MGQVRRVGPIICLILQKVPLKLNSKKLKTLKICFSFFFSIELWKLSLETNLNKQSWCEAHKIWKISDED